MVIDDYVWVGTCAMIMSEVTIGKGALVTVAFLVTKDVMTCQFVGGVPAKIMKETSQYLTCKLFYKRFLQ
jgi:acetyltransferase-like isoleucine patch superfamily enzyme